MAAQKLILGSASPRRKALLEAMGIPFEVRSADIEESYPSGLQGHEITDYLALAKARALGLSGEETTLVLTADTIVWFGGRVMEKPSDTAQARATLEQLSGAWHEVITSVCFSQGPTRNLVHAITRVKFAPLEAQMISSYLQKGHPLDKAGAYGIQEWIGLVGIEEVRGSYTNVVGLPTELVYKTLRAMGFPLF